MESVDWERCRIPWMGGISESPLNLAHAMDRQAARLAAKGKYQEAKLCHAKAAEYIREAIKSCSSGKVVEALRLQLAEQLKLQRVVQGSGGHQRPQQQARKTREAPGNRPRSGRAADPPKRKHLAEVQVDGDLTSRGVNVNDGRLNQYGGKSSSGVQSALQLFDPNSAVSGYFSRLNSYGSETEDSCSVAAHGQLAAENRELQSRLVRLDLELQASEQKNRKLNNLVSELRHQLLELQATTTTDTWADSNALDGNFHTPFSDDTATTASIPIPPNFILPLKPLVVPKFDL